MRRALRGAWRWASSVVDGLSKSAPFTTIGPSSARSLSWVWSVRSPGCLPARGVGWAGVLGRIGCLVATPRTACGFVHRPGVSVCGGCCAVVAFRRWSITVITQSSAVRPTRASSGPPRSVASRYPVGCAAGRPLKLHVRCFMRALSVILLAMFPVLGHTEVMDKEFSLVSVLLWGLIGSLLVFLAARLKPLLLFVLLPVIGLFFYSHLSELMDPYVGPAMAAEAGQLYFFISWAAPAMVLVGGGAGFAFRRRNAKANT